MLCRRIHRHVHLNMGVCVFLHEIKNQENEQPITGNTTRIKRRKIEQSNKKHKRLEKL